MNIASIANVKARLSNYIKESEEGPIIITKNGRPVAVLLPVLEEDDLESLILAYTPRFRHLIEAANERIEQTGGVSHDKFWQAIK